MGVKGRPTEFRGRNLLKAFISLLRGGYEKNQQNGNFTSDFIPL